MKKILYLLYGIKVWVLAYFYLFFPKCGTYGKLYCYKNVFLADRYVKIRNQILRRAERSIQKKQRKVIRIIVTDCTEWSTTQIYNYLNRRGIDISVVLAPFFHGTDDSIRNAYYLGRKFCEREGIRCIDPYDTKSWKLRSEYEQDILGDIMIYTNPWMGSYPRELQVQNIALSSITCYIPYGFMLFKHEQNQFNQISHNMFAHIYCETDIHREMYGQYCDIGNSHVKYAGHPRQDWYVEDKAIDEKTIWKGLSDNKPVIKIIYSPHWIVGETGTFLDNGLEILEYAEKHIQTTSWIYKPHPLLEKELILKGYMTADEYREYLRRWKELPNAEVYVEGDYGDIFLSSDCIINDSVSFIAEYMYAHKPMLLLTNGSAKFNDFGEKCKDYVYSCDSKNIEGIESFIENIAGNKDELKVERERFFEKYLDYYRHHGKTASDYIIAEILALLGLREEK